MECCRPLCVVRPKLILPRQRTNPPTNNEYCSCSQCQGWRVSERAYLALLSVNTALLRPGRVTRKFSTHRDGYFFRSLYSVQQQVSPSYSPPSTTFTSNHGYVLLLLILRRLSGNFLMLGINHLTSRLSLAYLSIRRTSKWSMIFAIIELCWLSGIISTQSDADELWVKWHFVARVFSQFITLGLNYPLPPPMAIRQYIFRFRHLRLGSLTKWLYQFG